MKWISFSILALFFVGLFSSCDTQQKAYSYRKKSKHPKFKTISCPSFGGEYDLIPTKPKDATGNDPEVNKGGILTASELNDLSNWKLWKDIDSNQLSGYKSTWNMQLKQRFTLVAMNEKKCPLANVKLKLTYKGKVVWEAVTDNHGLAQLWSDEPMNGDFKIECYADNRLVKTVERAVPFINGLNTVVLTEEPIVNNEVDIVFAVDATSSMEDEIDFLKADLMGIISKVKADFSQDDLQLGSVFYQCEGSDNEYVTVESDLSADIEKTLAFIRTKGATGGGDEVVDLALDKAVNSLSWRPNSRAKLLFILLDEPPASKPEIAERMAKVYKEAAAKGIRIIPCITSNGGYQTNRSLEYLMRNGAIATNGTLIFLTDDSGVGDSHTIPFTNDYTVELFRDVLTRVVKQYSEKGMCTEGGMDEVIKKESQSNKEDLVSVLMDSITKSGSDSLIAAILLPFTAFKTKEELIKNKPLSQIDTVAFLAHFEEQFIEMVVYPNPTLSDISIKTNLPMDYFELLDENGKLLWRLGIPPGQTEFTYDLSGFPSGVYLIRITVGESVLQSSIRKV